jgi:hypothetical protein
MKPLVRTLGVALLAVALMNASAGLCFCHRGPALPGDLASSHGCCHGSDVSGTTVVKAVSTCCQIESAESAATPAAAVQLAPPAAVVTHVALAVFLSDSLPPVAAALPSSSPPIFALRI